MATNRVNLLFDNKFDFCQVIQAYAIQRFLKRNFFFNKFIINDFFHTEKNLKTEGNNHKSYRDESFIKFIKDNINLDPYKKENEFDTLIISGMDSLDFYSLIKDKKFEFLFDYFASDVPRKQKFSIGANFSTTKIDEKYLSFLKGHLDYVAIDMNTDLFFPSYSMYTPNLLTLTNIKDLRKHEAFPLKYNMTASESNKLNQNGVFYAIWYDNYDFKLPESDLPVVYPKNNEHIGIEETIWILDNCKRIYTNNYIIFLLGLIFEKEMICDTYNPYIKNIYEIIIGKELESSYKFLYDPKENHKNIDFINFQKKYTEVCINYLKNYLTKVF